MDGGVKLCLHIVPAFGVATAATLCSCLRKTTSQKKKMNSVDRKCLDAFTNSKRKESLRLLQQIEHPNRLKNTLIGLYCILLLNMDGWI